MIIGISIFTCSINHDNNQDSNNNLISIVSIAMADSESEPSNTGPKLGQKCGALFCNVTEYYCQCMNEYSCTESLCPNHHP